MLGSLRSASQHRYILQSSLLCSLQRLSCSSQTFSTMSNIPALSSVAYAKLRDVHGDEVEASSLWAEQPMVVLVLRRPGCVLCRDMAQQLYSMKPQFDELGVGLACVAHEWIEREIKAFHPAFWAGPVYHDLDKAFYKALNNGKVLRGRIWPLFWPFSSVWRRIWDSSKRVKDHNVVGDGLTMGGLMVVRKGNGGICFTHLEKELGLMPEMGAVIEAAKKAAGRV